MTAGLLALTLAAAGVMAATAAAPDASFRQEVEKWRAKHEADYRREYVGLAGLFDVANHEGLPHRKNGFGNTLGRYGVKSGPYLYLPVLGPSSLRDAVGGVGDSAVLPNTVGEPFDRTDYKIGTAVVSGLDARVQYDSEIKTLYDTSLDPYATLRSVYQQSRAADITAITGKAEASPDDTMEDDLKDPAASPEATPPEAAPATAAPSDATLPEAAPSAGPK